MKKKGERCLRWIKIKWNGDEDEEERDVWGGSGSNGMKKKKGDVWVGSGSSGMKMKMRIKWSGDGDEEERCLGWIREKKSTHNSALFFPALVFVSVTVTLPACFSCVTVSVAAHATRPSLLLLTPSVFPHTLPPRPTSTETQSMAKLGEGDPRWRVRDREDGRNVGSWHWCVALPFSLRPLRFETDPETPQTTSKTSKTSQQGGEDDHKTRH